MAPIHALMYNKKNGYSHREGVYSFSVVQSNCADALRRLPTNTFQYIVLLMHSTIPSSFGCRDVVLNVFQYFICLSILNIRCISQKQDISHNVDLVHEEVHIMYVYNFDFLSTSIFPDLICLQYTALLRHINFITYSIYHDLINISPTAISSRTKVSCFLII